MKKDRKNEEKNIIIEYCALRKKIFTECLGNLNCKVKIGVTNISCKSLVDFNIF